MGGLGVLFGIFGVGVRLAFPNPDPISHKNMLLGVRLLGTWPLNVVPIFIPGF